MPYLLSCLVNLFYCSIIMIISLYGGELKVKEDLPKQYQQECYLKIYQNQAYTRENMVAMQVYKGFSNGGEARKWLPEVCIDIIFSFCTRKFFSRCNNENCSKHEFVLNRGFPEFNTFKIIDFIEPNPIHQRGGGFEIQLKPVIDKNTIEKVLLEQGDTIKETLLQQGFVDLSNNPEMVISNRNGKLFVACWGAVKYNQRKKLNYNYLPYLFKRGDSKKKQTYLLSIIDLENNNATKAEFEFNGKGDYLLDYYYCAGGCLFVTLIDEHPIPNIDGGSDRDPKFAPPKNHRVQIYDVNTKELIQIHKLDLPENCPFERYPYLLDYADETGYYIYNIDKEELVHYSKKFTLDIASESQEPKKDDEIPSPFNRMERIKKLIAQYKTVVFAAICMTIVVTFWQSFQKFLFNSMGSSS
jgi:hypothetical protein